MNRAEPQHVQFVTAKILQLFETTRKNIFFVIAANMKTRNTLILRKWGRLQRLSIDSPVPRDVILQALAQLVTSHGVTQMTALRAFATVSAKMSAEMMIRLLMGSRG